MCDGTGAVRRCDGTGAVRRCDGTGTDALAGTATGRAEKAMGVTDGVAGTGRRCNRVGTAERLDEVVRPRRVVDGGGGETTGRGVGAALCRSENLRCVCFEVRMREK
ncbi:hypothetical protein PIB30_055134 [Stylosanthes scabra]|uniref:Uncharacterized protein n=1 Tax=Stylosanthes scabra TaxID=79078 RepID=A0ABU6ZHN7_9FABA|nr:hypothetical protein [Stylosanthes scabra]